jgi:hypothetical protein
MKLAAAAGIGPDRISFLKVLKHLRRSVIAATVTTAAEMKLEPAAGRPRGRSRARLRLSGLDGGARVYEPRLAGRRG